MQWCPALQLLTLWLPLVGCCFQVRGSLLSYTLQDADLYALTFPSNEFLPLCESWAWNEMTLDHLHSSRQGKLQSWDTGFCFHLYQSFFFFFTVSFLSSQNVRVSIAPWGERNWEGCFLIIIFQWKHHTWDDMIQNIFISRSIRHVLDCWASRKIKVSLSFRDFSKARSSA